MTDGATGAVNSVSSLSISFSVTDTRYTSLLVSANAAGDNSTFSDSSSSGHTITASGDPTQGSFSPYRKGGYSSDFGGNGYLTVTNPTAIGAGDFTIDFWYRPRDASGGWQVIASTAYNATGSFRIYKYNGTRNFTLYFGPSIVLHSTGNGFTNGEWAYAAFVRSGSGSNNVKCYVNGILQGVGSSTETLDNAAMTIGAGASGALDYNGEIRDFRISTSALYTTASTTTGTDVFSSTLPTSSLPNVSSTILNTCNLPYFADTSASPRTITSTGDAKTMPSGPYDYSEVSTSDSGSIEFDGSGDALTLASGSITAPAGNFNLQFWVRPTSNSSNISIYDSAWVNGGICIYYHSSQTYYVFLGASSVTLNGVGGDAPVNSWHHLCVTRNGGTTKLYVNGKEIATSSTAVTFAQAAFDATTIGMRHQTSNRQYFNGLVSDLKFDSSNAIAGEFTPPTQPLSSSGADFHLKGQGAKVFDKSQGGNLVLNSAVGVQSTSASTPAQINSGLFANTFITDCSSATKYITAPDNGGLDGAFTIETYMYITGSLTDSGYKGIIGSNPSTGGSGYMAIVTNGTSIDFYAGPGAGHAEPIWTSLTIPTNTWFHFAIQRSATNYFSLYINGTKQTTGNSLATGGTAASGTVFGSNLDDLYYITRWHSDGYSLSTYLQDFRITDGLERYTINFTPHNHPHEG